MKNLLIILLLMAGCQPRIKEKIVIQKVYYVGPYNDNLIQKMIDNSDFSGGAVHVPPGIYFPSGKYFLLLDSAEFKTFCDTIQ